MKTVAVKDKTYIELLEVKQEALRSEKIFLRTFNDIIAYLLEKWKGGNRGTEEQNS